MREGWSGETVSVVSDASGVRSLVPMVRKFLKSIARRVLGRKDETPEPAKPAAKAARVPEKAPARGRHAAAGPRERTDATKQGHGRQAPQGRGHGARRDNAPGQNSERGETHADRERSRRERDSGHPPVESVTPWHVDAYQVPPKDGFSRFHDFNLPVEIMHAVSDLGFQYCTPIQARVLEPATAGMNVTGRAQTGTGKTAAFLISVFTRFLNNPDAKARPVGTPRALVLAPTRELCIQIASDAHDLGKYTKLRCVAVYGGMDFDKQARMLEQGPVDLIAATPGRLIDFLRRGMIDLSRADALVIDEADRMLDMGFIPDVRSIIRRMPPKHARQTLMFSATFTEDVHKLAAQWMDSPVLAEIEPEQVAVDTVKQLVYVVASRQKFTVLYNLLKQPDVTRTLVFGNRRDSTLELTDALRRHGITCGLLSGAIDQKKRLRILDEFKDGRLPVLVATDVAGRGLHIDGVSHVINYDFPYEADDYVHRIGRTGRAGAAGTAISFACEDESFIIPEIEAYIKRPLECRQPEAHLLGPLPPEIKGMRSEIPPEERQSGSGGGGRSSGPRRGGGRPTRGGYSRGGGNRSRRR